MQLYCNTKHIIKGSKSQPLYFIASGYPINHFAPNIVKALLHFDYLYQQVYTLHHLL